MQNANCGDIALGARAFLPQPPIPSPQPPRHRRAVTLIELLVTMLIITILAGLILGVASVAGETARKAQTRLTIQRLHKLMTEHYDTYKTRRVKVRQEVLDVINQQSGSKRGSLLAEARLMALRELMLMETPDRWSDVLLNDPRSGAVQYPFYLDVSRSNSGRTELSAIYLRRYQQYLSNSSVDAMLTNQSAECLYQMITLATGDGEARSLFGENAIGDTDGDGAPEFLDAWKRPIGFVRWAPGFDSQIQSNANELDFPPTGTAEVAWATAASGDHDPFDVYRVDSKAFRLIPLVFSDGGDEIAGIRTADAAVTWQGIPTTATSPQTNTGNWLRLLPYTKFDDNGENIYLGVALEEGAADNVHNHLLNSR